MSDSASSPRVQLDEEKMGFLEGQPLSDLESCSSGPDGDLPLLSEPSRSASASRPTPRKVIIVTSLLRRLESVHWRSFVLRAAIFFVPSFLQPLIRREPVNRSKTLPTAYLDGMRGLGALFVYFCHYFYQAFVIAEGWGCGDANYHILKLPFLRLWYQGPAAVCVFFVVSGYALSYRPLKFIRNNAAQDFSKTMSSLVFRRGIRLFLPTALSTLLIVALLQSGVYELTRDFATNRTLQKNVMEPHPEPKETLAAQLTDWAWAMFYFVHVFGWDIYGGQPRAYDVHLWTIPLEFRCSLYLFLVLMGTARLRTAIRLSVVAGILGITYRNCRWDLFLFLCGMVIAEMDLIRGAHNPATTSLDKARLRLVARLRSAFWIVVSISGLYLLGAPDARAEITPGWVYLSSLIPTWWSEERYRYWQSAGAVIFVLAVGHSAFWQRFFNSAVVQYFGKISYAMYLMHAPAMHAVGYHWERWAFALTGVEGYWYNAGFVLGACFCIPTVIWWADVFWRAVDMPTVRFAKWAEAKCVDKE